MSNGSMSYGVHKVAPFIVENMIEGQSQTIQWVYV